MYSLFVYTVPGPASLMLTSSIPNPIRPVGSDIILICTVTLNNRPEIDSLLTVNAEVSKSYPDGHSLTTTPLSVSGSTYNTTVMIRSFWREQSGNYTCTATVSSPNYFINSISQSQSIRITTGKTIHELFSNS